MKTKQTDAYDFNVIRQSIYSKGTKVDGFVGNFREDTGECLAVTSKKYKIVQNRDVLETIESCLDYGGFTRQTYSVAGGRRMYAVYDFDREQREIAPGDNLGFRLLAKNSYDGSTGVTLAAGLLRYICANGMVSMAKESQVTKVHNNRIDLKFLRDTIKESRFQWLAAVDFYKAMSNRQITQDEGSVLIKKMELGDRRAKRIEETWTNPTYELDHSRNIYNLYNAVTQELTPLSEKSFELAQHTSHRVLNFLSKQ